MLVTQHWQRPLRLRHERTTVGARDFAQCNLFGMCMVRESDSVCCVVGYGGRAWARGAWILIARSLDQNPRPVGWTRSWVARYINAYNPSFTDNGLRCINQGVFRIDTYSTAAVDIHYYEILGILRYLDGYCVSVRFYAYIYECFGTLYLGHQTCRTKPPGAQSSNRISIQRLQKLQVSAFAIFAPRARCVFCIFICGCVG